MAGNDSESNNNDNNYDDLKYVDDLDINYQNINDVDKATGPSPSPSPSQPQYQEGAIPVSGRQSEENIPDKIGKGDDAKNSVVWHVITYSLTIYSCIVAALLVIDVVGNGGRSALTIVKDSWAIFTPIITLSLGYMFGKNEESRNPSSPS